MRQGARDREREGEGGGWKEKSGNRQKERGWKAWYEAALLESWRGRRVFLRAEGENGRRQVARRAEKVGQREWGT